MSPGAFASRASIRPSALGGPTRYRSASSNASCSRALALKPSVLLLDEPTSALDEATKAAIEGTLRDLHGRLGLCFVLVTHELAQATRLADSVLVLEPSALREAPTMSPRTR
jgi:ABC-type sulfate/molybdate transport systems ATPase subunit